MTKIILIFILTLSTINLYSQDKSYNYSEFNKKISSIPLNNSTIDNIIDYFLLETKELDKFEKDSLFSTIFRVIVEKENLLNDHLFKNKEYEDYNSLMWSDTKLHTESALEYQKKLNLNNIRIASVEGNIYLIYDFENKYDLIKSQLSKSTQNLFDLIILERDYPTTEDAGLIISLNELVDRIIRWEDQVEAAFPMFDVIIDEYKYNLQFLTQGVENTPISYDSINIQKEFLEAYDYMIKKYPNSKSSKIIERYYKMIRDNGFKLNEKIRKFNIIID